MPIAITPDLFFGTEDPKVSGHYTLVSSLEEVIDELVARGMTPEEAQERVAWVFNSVHGELFVAAPGQDIE